MQHSVLCAILPMASECPGAFVPHLRAFFVNETSDALFIKLLKLDVLSLLANQANVRTVLRELQTYVTWGSISFVTAAIRAVGRLANALPSVADQCLRGLMQIVTDSQVSHATSLPRH